MTDFIPYIAPLGFVVSPPVTPEKRVDVIWSDSDTTTDVDAGDLNWSAQGDGPKIIAYRVKRPEPVPLTLPYIDPDHLAPWVKAIARDEVRNVRCYERHPVRLDRAWSSDGVFG